MNSELLFSLMAQAARVPTLSEMFDADKERSSRFTVDACGIHADFSRQHIDAQLLSQLVAAAADVDIAQNLSLMMSGATMNDTENRAVLHTASRDISGTTDSARTAQQYLVSALKLAESVRSGAVFTTVINIGIGGSDLGPAMATKALRRFQDGPEIRFVSNIDAADLDAALHGLRPENTLFVVSSKTFTTLETIHNAERARNWLSTSVTDVSAHFVAATAHPARAMAWGIKAEQCLQFEEWVGGRFSLSSVIGFPLMCAIGAERFSELLSGMRAMDEHVLTAETSSNLAVMHALVWFANASLHGYASVAVIPYSHDLGRLPAYLQQLVMESNGKGVDVNGEALEVNSSPVVWGEPGTNGQHAFFQMLHQGTQIVPVEFIGSVAPLGNDAHAHDLLNANMIAQSEALASGKTSDMVYQRFVGNKPSSVIMLDALSPRTLGSLLSMYEHSTAVQGWLVGVNSFDQFGVELGKAMAVIAAESIEAGVANPSQTMTHPLMSWYLGRRSAIS
jgi:glucose-6-phosphate isomerase